MSVLSDLPRPITRYTIGLWHRRWLIITLAWLLAMAGWVALYFYPDAYQSKAQIYLNTDTALNTEIGQSATAADLEKRVRVMRLALLTPENLEQVIFETGMIADLPTEIELERRIASLQKNINVFSNEEQYFNISYMDQDPVMAQKVVRSIVNVFIEKDIGAAQADNEVSLRKFQTELEETESRLQEKDLAIATYRREFSAELSGGDRSRRLLDIRETSLSNTEERISQALRRRDSLSAQLATIPRNSPGKELDSLKIQLAQLQSQFNENYPDIISLKARIAELENAGSALPSNPEYKRAEAGLQSVQDEVAGLRQRRANLQAEINELIEKAAKEPEAQAGLQEIMRGRKELELQYSKLQQSINKMGVTTRLSRDGGTIQYSIFEAPKVAAEPSSPLRGLLSWAFAIMGLGVAAGLAFLLAQVDRSYIQTADLEDALGLPVLGAISPALTPAFRRRKFIERFSLATLLTTLFVAAAAQYWYHEIRVSPDSGANTVSAMTSIGQRTGS